MSTEEQPEVMVAMSGGVDSSVAALLLKNEGYQVTGVTFWLWDYPGSPEYRGKENACCSTNIAQIAADQLDIPHRQMDISDEFEQQVVQYTINSYKQGRTPNPCARCNRYIRFGLALEQAREWGFNYIATGHHVRKQKRGGKFRLLTGVDPEKDQSYFLYSLTQQELRHSLFPVGKYHKDEIYEIAEDKNLVSAHLSESQDLCFVPEGDYRDFLDREIGSQLKPGPIIDTEGNRLGTHNGLPYYTIGQRRGLGLETNRARYVVAMHPEENELVIGSKSDLYSNGLIARDCSWVAEEGPPSGDLLVKIRYRTDRVPATLQPKNNSKVQLNFDKPQRAVTPGQVAVFYRNEETLGGGTIERALN